MSDKKVQGEGDYEAARHYRKATERSVKEQAKSATPVKDQAEDVPDELTPAEIKGRSRARDAGQDQRDAQYMDKLEKNKRS